MTLKKYNPGFLSEDELVRSFAVRTHELETILQVLRENTGDTNQHLMVIAPRGFGKSTLVLRVAAEVRRDPVLARSWFPLVFSEESYEVGSVAELWLEALLHLAECTGAPRWWAAWQELRRQRDDERLAVAALAHLLDFADEVGRRILLIVENVDQVLGGDQISRDDAWDLRKILLHERRILLLGTATRRFAGLDQPGEAMFDLFRRVEMDPLTPRECDDLWRVAAGERIGIRRAKALRVLSGGNPRLLVILAEFAREHGLGDVMETLDHLIDDHTDYFRQNVEALTGQARRVFLALAELWKPSSARDVALQARLPVNESSAVLGRLVDQGRVAIVGTRARAHSYQVAERLYNIYYLMRRHRGAEPRVRALIDFINHLFAPGEVPRLFGAIAQEACVLPEGRRSEHLLVIGHLLCARRNKPSDLACLLDSLPTEIVRASDLPEMARKGLRRPAALTRLLAREGGEVFLDEAARAAVPSPWTRPMPGAGTRRPRPSPSRAGLPKRARRGRRQRTAPQTSGSCGAAACGSKHATPRARRHICSNRRWRRRAVRPMRGGTSPGLYSTAAPPISGPRPSPCSGASTSRPTRGASAPACEAPSKVPAPPSQSSAPCSPTTP